jgi:hypothetical protein
MDNLSEGIGIRNPGDTTKIEFLSFLAGRDATLKDMPVKPVWAPIGQLFHEPYFQIDKFPLELTEHYRKVSFDVRWAMTMEHLAMSLEGSAAGSVTTAERINLERQTNPRGDKSFKDLFSDELDGILDAMMPDIEKSLKYAEQFAGVEATEGPLDEPDRRQCIRWIRESVRHDAGGKVMPSLRVAAALYAAIRLNDRHLFKQNDIADIEHCSVAAAYCDVFLTERMFTDILGRPAVQNVIPRGCLVICDIDRAISVLSK